MILSLYYVYWISGRREGPSFFSKYVYNESNLAVEIPFNVKPYVAEKILRGPNVG